MNQILITNPSKTGKKRLIAQLLISIIAITVIIFLYVNYRSKLNKQENFSKILSKNYKLSKLYSSSNVKNSQTNETDILGTISIPSLNISYTFFFGISDALLKISPCRLSGQMPDSKSNLCIAGHNYNDDRFFGKIFLLRNNDKIIIKDNSNNQFTYYVYDKYEVKEDDLSPISDNKLFCELTLITCNNFNNNRLIIKAKTGSLQ